jgi:hypothetical protein
VLCAVVASVASVGFAAAPVRDGAASIAVMNCGLIDDNAVYNDADANRIQQARIEMISNALRAQLDASQRYRVADNGSPAARPCSSVRSTFAAIRTCRGAAARRRSSDYWWSRLRRARRRTTQHRDDEPDLPRRCTRGWDDARGDRWHSVCPNVVTG